MPVLRSLISILRNKYLVSLLVFAIIILFMDHNNIFEQLDRKKQLNELQAGKKFYEAEIEKTEKELSDLQNNPAALEKYAREKFYMKKDNEDLFIVETPAKTAKK